MNFTREEINEISDLVQKRITELESQQNSAPHSNQELMQTEIDLLNEILLKLEGSNGSNGTAPMPGGGRKRKTRKGRKARKGSRKNRKD